MLDIRLLRTDLLQTTATAPGCLAVLPIGEKKIQKVAVGDSSGVVQCFSVKRGEIASSFKTLPNNQRVSSVNLGRAKAQRDRIIIATGMFRNSLSSAHGLARNYKNNVIQDLSKTGKRCLLADVLCTYVLPMAVSRRPDQLICE